MRVPALAAIVLAVAFCGCGSLDRAELKRGIDTLTSVAAEGRLVADGVAGDRTKATFARVHARALAEDASHEAEKLADASPQPGTERQRDEAVAIALRLDDALGQISTYPGGERTAAEARRDLRSIEGELEHLAERLEDVP
jgi:hypothetical protein